jgi:hypothetical protein
MNPGWDALTDGQRQRWTTVLTHLITAIPPGAPAVLVDCVQGGIQGGDEITESGINSRAVLQRTRWQLSTYDDPPHRFLAIAVRVEAVRPIALARAKGVAGNPSTPEDLLPRLVNAEALRFTAIYRRDLPDSVYDAIVAPHPVKPSGACATRSCRGRSGGSAC